MPALFFLIEWPSTCVSPRHERRFEMSFTSDEEIKGRIQEVIAQNCDVNPFGIIVNGNQGDGIFNATVEFDSQINHWNLMPLLAMLEPVEGMDYSDPFGEKSVSITGHLDKKTKVSVSFHADFLRRGKA